MAMPRAGTVLHPLAAVESLVVQAVDLMPGTAPHPLAAGGWDGSSPSGGGGKSRGGSDAWDGSSPSGGGGKSRGGSDAWDGSSPSGGGDSLCGCGRPLP
ncbi:hypothetical protein IFM46972_11294 [Aspergillus udagawae]|uniref:Uncharacterized protein n=1 Tax=Aspergillus udagawae TaxID=91492 RepID=A0A8H3SGQ9_9EURO|nr:hypothetical protein IFM46972_11294 [Aspergillus udagawae]